MFSSLLRNSISTSCCDLPVANELFFDFEFPASLVLEVGSTYVRGTLLLLEGTKGGSKELSDDNIGCVEISMEGRDGTGAVSWGHS